MSCFDNAEERLYLVEMRVDSVELAREKIEEVAGQPLVVHVKFSDFPVAVISHGDFYGARDESSTLENDGVTVFRSGRSFLFPCQPRDLSRIISSPLRVGVYREGDTFPLAETRIFLPGCVCDQIAMSGNDAENLPKPYSIRKNFDLHDPGKNLSGKIDFLFRLTTFGKFITTKFLFEKDNFLMKRDGGDREYRVEKLTVQENSKNADIVEENGAEVQNTEVDSVEEYLD